MMIRSVVTGSLLLVFGAVPSLAAERGPVCREPSVVDEIAREVLTHDYYGSVASRLITETSTSHNNLVRCHVCVQSAPYDAIRFGEHPIGQCLERVFEVRIVPNGFVVRDLR